MKLSTYVHFWSPKICLTLPCVDFRRHLFTVNYSIEYMMWWHKDNTNFFKVCTEWILMLVQIASVSLFDIFYTNVYIFFQKFSMQMSRYVHFWCPKIFFTLPCVDFRHHWFSVNYSIDYIMRRQKNNNMFLKVWYLGTEWILMFTSSWP